MENELNSYINKEIQFLKITYNIHIIECIILLLIYFIAYENIYWLINSIASMFEISLFIFIFLYFFLLFIYLSFLFLKMTTKLLKVFIIISLICFCIVFVNSLFCSVISCYNSALFDSFYNDCPFNFMEDDITKMIGKSIKNNKKANNICKSRKCYKINNETNIYLCNFYEKEIYYDSHSEKNDTNISQEVNLFVYLCKNFTNFYLSKKDKYHAFDIDYDFNCPSKSNIIYNYILTYLFIIANILCSAILWLFEFCSYKTILLLITNLRNNDVSLKETNNTSKIEENNNSHNQENNLQHNGTEIIIVENNKNNKNKNLEENKDINKENSKSENLLINNINNNIFKIMNQKEQIKKNDENK